MLAAAEFTGPTSYSPWLTWLAILLPVLVVTWYAGVTWWSRSASRPRATRAERHRREHLARLDRVEAEVGGGDLSLREAHQEISEIVRSFAAAVGGVDTRAMNLEQLRSRGPAPVADLVALVYPPEFSPGSQGHPADRLGPALSEARAVVTGWAP
ncbi:hypothetical protein [Nocardioides lijunqiniae]|uniref:hypothetical protein n=1 Tax=Nocardioides lijunqiniae TaxID=2760832 RepID=UPI00187851F8|nr:hypothetical protein [Nocardioides lijunqiniae]